MSELVLKKRRCVLWFPISLTTYEVVKSREDYELIIKSGLIARHEEKIKLFKINDTTFDRSLSNFFFGVGNIILESSDASSRYGRCCIQKIHGAREFQKQLEDLVFAERKRVNIKYTENNIVR